MRDPKLRQYELGPGCEVDPQAWLGFEESGAGSIVLGRGVKVRPLAMLRTCGGRIEIGDGSSIGAFSVFHALGGIRLGNGVLVSPHVGIYAQRHGIAPGRPIAGQRQQACPVEVGDDVWIGAGAILVGPLKVGAGAVIGAGAVVTSDVPAGVVVGGVPARQMWRR